MSHLLQIQSGHKHQESTSVKIHISSFFTSVRVRVRVRFISNFKVALAGLSKIFLWKVFVIILSIRIHPLESKEGWGLNPLRSSPLQLQSQSMVCMCDRPHRPDVCGEGSPHPMVRLRRNIACWGLPRPMVRLRRKLALEVSHTPWLDLGGMGISRGWG